MASLKDFNFQHWWTLLAAAGVVIAGASISIQNMHGLSIGLGLIACGVGEWNNRPPKPTKQTVEGLSGLRVVETHPWQPNAFGLLLDAIGIVLICLGLPFVAFAP